MAVKFFTESKNCMPFVEIKASPLKLLQGHNIFGFDDLELGAVHMLGMLEESHSKLFSILEYQKAELLALDVTAYARLPSQGLVQPVLDYLANCSSGHRKARKVKFENYVTWCSDTARYLRPKAYGKFEEVKSQLKDLQRKADKGNMRAKQLVQIMHDKLPLANAVVRFEGRVCKTYLIKNGYPSNLWELINLQKQKPTLLKDFWHVVFDPILQTLDGEYMTFANDYELKDTLDKKLVRYTAKGNKTLSDSHNAYKLYIMLREKGFKETKLNYSKSTFFKHLNLLIKAGIPKAELQNLHNPNAIQPVPMRQLVHIDFSNQLPADYVKPTSEYLQRLKVA